MTTQQTILLGLNEINFDFIKYYISQGKLPVLGALLSKYKLIETESEKKYELLEPWIQWVTVHTGLTYDEHRVFRLGDITEREDVKQIWEELEEKGISVGAVSPFNADNRLKNPAFFIPDPWTKTKTSGDDLVTKVSQAVQQSVNDNAHAKLSKTSALSLLQGLISYTPVTRWPHFVALASQIKKPGTKAVILDNLLADTFIHHWKKQKPDFSSLFLNTGAHIQHHYLFNSTAYDGDLSNPEWYCPAGYDPLIKVLEQYDQIIGRILGLNTRLIIATGLHQKPHNHMTYYWRLKNHTEFLQKIGLNDMEVLPRMSRDLLINFKTETTALHAEKIMSSYKSSVDGEAIFMVDNRGKSLFVELAYPNEVSDSMKIMSDIAPTVDNFKEEVAFVAIKNGEHDGIGYVLTNFDLNGIESKIPLTQVNSMIKNAVLN